MRLAQTLNAAGFAVIAHDPIASRSAAAILGAAARIVPSAREAVQQADVTVIVTPWSEYARIHPSWVSDGRKRSIVDCWQQLDAKAFAGSCVVLRLGEYRTFAIASKQAAAE
jgi:UDPglucose 6-dehydrogenase